MVLELTSLNLTGVGGSDLARRYEQMPKFRHPSHKEIDPFLLNQKGLKSKNFCNMHKAQQVFPPRKSLNVDFGAATRETTQRRNSTSALSTQLLSPDMGCDETDGELRE